MGFSGWTEPLPIQRIVAAPICGYGHGQMVMVEANPKGILWRCKKCRSLVLIPPSPEPRRRPRYYE